MITLLEVIHYSESFLAKHAVARARREAEEVIADVLKMKRLDLYLQFDRPICEHERSALRKAIQRRAQHEPTAYIAGKVEFAGITLSVTPSVLIPRPETEILIEKITTKFKQHDLSQQTLWDVCCGSGCIGLSLKNRFPQLEVTLSDISQEALDIARINSEGNVFFKQGDLFAPFSGLKCDFLVCNPPYVSQADYLLLSPEVRKWEPKLALLGGECGLDFYKRIAVELKNYLNPNGKAWLEIGTGQGKAVKHLFESAGWKAHYESDWAGHDRFLYITA